MRILYVEPFEGGSHAAFTRTLTRLPATWTTVTLPGRHWKWRMRQIVPHVVLERADALEPAPDLVFASSYVPLAELVGLAPSLHAVPRVLYFHENQLTYPERDPKERDYHFGFTQMVSALAATRCVFNSEYNRRSFLEAARALLGRMPDRVPAGFVEAIEDRSEVIAVPLDLEDVPPPQVVPDARERKAGPVILWNHRWEHDKGPDAFFEVLGRLVRDAIPFRVMVCGERFRRAPEVFEAARRDLGPRVIHWGSAPTRAAYLALLGCAHVVVSTAVHEFFGLSVLEATHLGALPLVPDRLAYSEVFPPVYRYADVEALTARLRACCLDFVQGRDDLRADRRTITRPFLREAVLPRFDALFRRLHAAAGVSRG